MAKKAIDMWINPEDYENLIEILKIAHKLGFGTVAVEIEEKKLMKELNNLEREYKVKILRRKTIVAEKEEELRKSLRGIKKLYDVVAVKPLSYPVARFAARDGRVDLVIIDNDSIRYLDLSEIRLLEQFNGALELPLNHIIAHISKARFLTRLISKTRLITRYDPPVIVSSAASNVYNLWHPLQMIGFLMLIGIPESKATSAVIVEPFRIITRIRG